MRDVYVCGTAEEKIEQVRRMISIQNFTLLLFLTKFVLHVTFMDIIIRKFLMVLYLLIRLSFNEMRKKTIIEIRLYHTKLLRKYQRD